MIRKRLTNRQTSGLIIFFVGVIVLWELPVFNDILHITDKKITFPQLNEESLLFSLLPLLCMILGAYLMFPWQSREKQLSNNQAGG